MAGKWYSMLWSRPKQEVARLSAWIPMLEMGRLPLSIKNWDSAMPEERPYCSRGKFRKSKFSLKRSPEREKLGCFQRGGNLRENIWIAVRIERQAILDGLPYLRLTAGGRSYPHRFYVTVVPKEMVKTAN